MWALLDKRPSGISTSNEPFPTPVSGTFFSSNEVLGVVIPLGMSRQAPVGLLPYSRFVPTLFEMEKNAALGDGGSTEKPGARCAINAILRSRLGPGLGAHASVVVADGVAQVLGLTDLHVANPGLKLDDVPRLEDPDITFIDIDRGVDLVDVRLQAPDATGGFGRNNITFLADLDARRGRERYCMGR